MTSLGRVAKSQKKTVLLGVTGSIAAYKAVLLCRMLQKAGFDVEVLMTKAAQAFVGAPTFLGLGARVHDTMWSNEPGEKHVELAKKASAFVIAPATAETISHLAQGRAHDLLSATALCFRGPLVIAPAMHPEMWSHPATQDNVQLLKQRGAILSGPVHGEVASGDVGAGRMAEPEEILSTLELSQVNNLPLRGRTIVVTAGPTSEALDPVRALTNRSSGKMGFALAERAARLGAKVHLVSGPVALATPHQVERHPVQSALEMQAVLDEILGPTLTGADVLIMAAAVADYRPVEVSLEKLKKTGGPLSLELVQNPDLLATLGRRRTESRPLLIGFALETAGGDALIQLARRKLIDKRADLIVANSANESLGLDEGRVMLVTPQDCRKLEFAPKRVIADKILEWLVARLEAPELGEFSA